MAYTLDQLWTTLKERFTGYLPISYEVAVNIDGGCAFEYDPANPGKVKLAAAGSTTYLGVAKYFAAPGENWAESGGGRVRGLVANEPIPNKVAGLHMGFYDIVNSGDVTVNPGQAVFVVGDNGLLGRLTAAIPTDQRAVVGTCVGLATGNHLNNTGTATNARPVPVGQKMRVRLGRG